MKCFFKQNFDFLDYNHYKKKIGSEKLHKFLLNYVEVTTVFTSGNNLHFTQRPSRLHFFYFFLHGLYNNKKEEIPKNVR